PDRLIDSLTKDTFYLLSLVLLVAVVFAVPQISNVMWQTVQTGPGFSPRHLWHKGTVEAFGFLLFLSFLAVGTVASLLFVVPPSFLSEAGEGAQPIHLHRWPRWRRLGGVAVFLALLPVFVILPLPQWLLLLLAVVLLFRPISRRVASWSGWLVW